MLTLHLQIAAAKAEILDGGISAVMHGPWLTTVSQRLLMV